VKNIILTETYTNQLRRIKYAEVMIIIIIIMHIIVTYYSVLAIMGVGVGKGVRGTWHHDESL